MWVLAGVLLVALFMSGCKSHPTASPQTTSTLAPLAEEFVRAVPLWVKKEELPQKAVPGAKLFATAGCLNCHRYLSAGSSELSAPNLTAEGLKGRGIKFQIAHLKCPSCVVKGSVMPQFLAFGKANLGKVAIFLEASQGVR